ncbi:DUF1566 domain-containing protein [Myxococcota bacterium]|nr:DUF1566 domain-containing protein [Myxococcota bacterium]MBU1382915.1 DUF1566 domain-containing protein [Myxococcota bacterium]MBU1497110.1 DUF1566 domain-containing protein [Myxococcota bacterium]
MWNKLMPVFVLIALYSCDDDGGGPCRRSNDLEYCDADGVGGICIAGNCVARANCENNCSEGVYFPLPDTNLRVCYGPSDETANGEIPCSSNVGSDSCAQTALCGQDAQYGWDTGHESNERFSVNSGDDTVADNVTGFMWQRCSAGQGEVCDGTAVMMNWADAVSYCENLDAGGYNDWVLPGRFELQSIVDYSVQAPAMDTSVFVNTPSEFHNVYELWWSECYWTYTDYARDSDVAWALLINSGDIGEGSGYEYHLNTKDAADWDGCYVKCMRKTVDPPQQTRFTVLSDTQSGGIVADSSVSVLWQRCSAGQSGEDCTGEATMMNWEQGLSYCESLELMGYDDWRLPNIREISSLIDSSRTSPAIDTSVFPNTPYYGKLMDNNAGHYWSSTARSYNNFVLYADFSSGFTHFYIMEENRHIRCVRSVTP